MSDKPLAERINALFMTSGPVYRIRDMKYGMALLREALPHVERGEGVCVWKRLHKGFPNAGIRCDGQVGVQAAGSDFCPKCGRRVEVKGADDE